MIKPGTTLAQYEFVSPLGRGGMGEVWLAHDSKLGRDVAIKNLPDEYLNDDERLARLRREAKLLASLNHPNIATLYSLDEYSGIRFLVMELIEGPTLEERIAKGPIPLEEALDIAMQIADALEAANDRGIIHRDLKPANIKLTKNGRVKVLDFGLAKPTPNSGDIHRDMPTVSQVTELGQTLGTPGYMSPEQIRGDAIDARADIWAFGVILTEMLTGQPLFQGRTTADSIARALAPGEVDLNLPADTPMLVTHVIRRCVAKDVNQRLRNIGDARLDLAEAIQAPEEYGQPAPADRRTRSALHNGLLATALLGFGLLIGWLFKPEPERVDLTEHYDISTAANVRGALPTSTPITISADGTQIAYSTAESLFVYSVDDGVTTQRLEGFSPFFAPDGSSIGYFADAQLQSMPIAGGSPSVITRIRSRELGGSWGPNRIVYATNDGLFTVPPEGSNNPRLLIAPSTDRGELSFAWPELLPDDNKVVFTILPIDAGNGPDLAVLDLETLEYRRLLPNASGARYLDTGHLIFSRAGELMAIDFDMGSLDIDGAPRQLNYAVEASAPTFAISADGTLVFTPPQPTPARSSVWIDFSSGAEVSTDLPEFFARMIYQRSSHDGSMIVTDVSADGNRDLYLWDLERRVPTKLTTDPREDLFGYFSQDDESIYFSSDRLDNTMKVFVVPIDRSREPELVYGEPDAQIWLMGVLSDRLLASRVVPGEPTQFLTISTTETREIDFIVSVPAGNNVTASPDEQWIAYQSEETGTTEVWVRSLDAVTPTKVQVSTAGGYQPSWSPDGQKLYYVDFEGALMSVDVIDNVTFRPSASYEALEYRYFSRTYSNSAITSGRIYEIASDGRMLITKTEPIDFKTIKLVRGFSTLLD